IDPGILRGQSPADGAHLRSRLVERDARLELSGGCQKMPAVVLRLLRRERHRRQQVQIAPADRKCRRHYANDDVILTVERNSTAQDFLITAESPLPQPVA